jgi:hypothetical protein
MAFRPCCGLEGSAPGRQSSHKCKPSRLAQVAIRGRPVFLRSNAPWATYALALDPVNMAAPIAMAAAPRKSVVAVWADAPAAQSPRRGVLYRHPWIEATTSMLRR